MRDENEREVVLQREMTFPPELVWTAMTDPYHVNQWFGPDGFRNERVSMDFRVGGTWTFDMVAPDGTRFPNHCVFKEIVPQTRMVYDQGDGERTWFETTITLEKTAKGTLITIRQLFPTREERDHVVTTYGAIEGGRQHLAKLEAYVSRHLAPSIARKA
jgi:uncharacterized protein YndB with AHSA1/START domain